MTKGLALRFEDFKRMAIDEKSAKLDFVSYLHFEFVVVVFLFVPSQQDMTELAKDPVTIPTYRVN